MSRKASMIYIAFPVKTCYRSSFSLSVRDMCITLRACAPVSEVCAVACA